jgi:hypothetical protein
MAGISKSWFMMAQHKSRLRRCIDRMVEDHYHRAVGASLERVDVIGDIR